MRLNNADVLLAWPLASHIITAGWTYNDNKAHNAIDLRAALKTPVYAAEDGTVDWTQDWDERTTTGMMSYGTGVRIRHADYRGGALQTRYAHLSKRLVKTGDQVREGQLIGYSGATGNCYGAHLHFEVIYKGARVNPLNWMDSDFTVKDAAVGAHLGEYTSVQATVTESRTGVFGVDVSKYQGTIDWNAVAADGAKYAILRAGSCDNHGPYVDPTFEANYRGAKAAGLKVGAYLYTYATTEAAQNAELEVWLPALAGKTFDYPVFVDVENNSLISLGKTALTALVKRCMDILDQKGYTPGWYSYTNYINNYLDAGALSAYPLWVADYREALGYTGEYMMWQYTSSGRVAGIDGNVDCNWDYSGTCDAAPTEPTPPVQLQKLCVISPSAALVGKAEALGLPVQDAAAKLIGPVSDGDAMTLWMMAQAEGSPYFASYTEV